MGRATLLAIDDLRLGFPEIKFESWPTTESRRQDVDIEDYEDRGVCSRCREGDRGMEDAATGRGTQNGRRTAA